MKEPLILQSPQEGGKVERVQLANKLYSSQMKRCKKEFAGLWDSCNLQEFFLLKKKKKVEGMAHKGEQITQNQFDSW